MLGLGPSPAPALAAEINVESIASVASGQVAYGRGVCDWATLSVGAGAMKAPLPGLLCMRNFLCTRPRSSRHGTARHGCCCPPAAPPLDCLSQVLPCCRLPPVGFAACGWACAELRGMGCVWSGLREEWEVG